MINDSSTVNIAVQADRICDRIPLVSTVSNLVDLFEKASFKCCQGKRSINENRYFSHIKDKSIWRCFLLLVPVIGNIVVAICDFAKSRAVEKKREAEEKKVAEQLGIRQLPSDKSERKKAMDVKLKEKLEPLDRQIQTLKELVKEFNQLVRDGKLEKSLLGGTSLYNDSAITLEYKLGHFWADLGCKFAEHNKHNDLTDFQRSKKNMHPAVFAKHEEILKLRSELADIRCRTYKDYLSKCDDVALMGQVRTHRPFQLMAGEFTFNEILCGFKGELENHAALYGDIGFFRDIKIKALIEEIERRLK